MDHVFTYTQGTRGSHVQAAAREHGAMPSHIRKKYTAKIKRFQNKHFHGQKKCFRKKTLPRRSHGWKKYVSQKRKKHFLEKNYMAKNKPFPETKNTEKTNPKCFRNKIFHNFRGQNKTSEKTLLKQIYNKKKIFSKTNLRKNKVAEQTLPHRYKGLITDRWNRSGTYSNREIQQGLY